jgi:hypothetical protein
MSTMKPFRQTAAILFSLMIATLSCTQKMKNDSPEQNNVVQISSENSSAVAEFDEYVSSLEELQLPFSLDSINDYKKHSTDYNKDLFLKFKHKWALSPYGVLFQEGGITGILYVTVGDALVPIITTYKRDGAIISDLNPYEKSGHDIGYHSSANVLITEDKRIIIVDSTTTYDLNEAKDDILRGTQKLTIDTTVYKVTADGQIKAAK